MLDNELLTIFYCTKTMTDKMATCTLIVPFICIIRKAYLIDVDMTLNPQ